MINNDYLIISYVCVALLSYFTPLGIMDYSHFELPPYMLSFVIVVLSSIGFIWCFQKIKLISDSKDGEK